jgi:RNA polymerase sigma-70 factor
MDPLPEAELVAAAVAGDREAFSGLVRLHQARLRALVALSVHGHDDVLDIVQESFLDAWRALARFDTTREFGPWLRTLCRNRVARFLRDRLPRRRRELALVDQALADGGEVDDALAERRLDSLRRCLETLGDDHRRLLARRYQDEVAVQELAAELGKSANGVSMILLRLKTALMRCVAGHELAGGA